MHRSLRGALLAAVGLLFLFGTVALAAVWYDGAHRDELLPGVTVGDVAAGGRPAAAVVRALDAQLPPAGQTALRIVAGDRDATVTLSDLGLRSDAAETVARARAEADRMGVATRVWHRVLNKPVARSYDVQLTVEREAVRRRVAELAAEVEQAPVDARIDTSSGMVSILPAAEGRALDVDSTTARVFDAAARMANGAAPVAGTDVLAPVTPLAPKVTGFADVILVRTAENKLYHYDNGNLVKTYSVATGTSKFPTPKGNFSVVLKRRNPTWVNPDPGGWGRSLPARIGPGPRNPLGTRAMNLDAPGIRIHGTSNVSSLGHSASHGCIRMAMSDVEELFEL
ncbi:MAG: L,D-transpeptidase family protein, partial [Acidimicrobiales bacterium]